MELLTDKKLCCGCGACQNICPRSAISMRPDDYGFLYPSIDSSLCVDCGKCRQVCSYTSNSQKSDKRTKAFAAVTLDWCDLQNSTSGGAFSALALWIIAKGGVVFECAWDEDLLPHHVAIEKADDLHLLQGSKYVQSEAGFVYKDVQKVLDQGNFVLFSGTPCQCASLRSFLEKDYPKLYCVELICHGVPNVKMYHDYLQLMEKKLHGKIVNLRFRDKKLGWGALMRIDFITQTGTYKTRYLKPEESYYYYYFYMGLFFRESCYSCRYANVHRESDFAIGDYWGGALYHPSFDSQNGISALIATGKKALCAMGELQSYMYIEETKIDNVKAENGQLVKPSVKNDKYDELMQKYMALGCEQFDCLFRKTHKKEILSGFLKRKIPSTVKSNLRKVLH